MKLNLFVDPVRLSIKQFNHKPENNIINYRNFLSEKKKKNKANGADHINKIMEIYNTHSLSFGKITNVKSYLA